MKCWLSGCDEAMRIRMDGGAIGVQIEQQCRLAMLLVTAPVAPFPCATSTPRSFDARVVRPSHLPFFISKEGEDGSQEQNA